MQLEQKKTILSVYLSIYISFFVVEFRNLATTKKQINSKQLYRGTLLNRTTANIKKVGEITL